MNVAVRELDSSKLVMANRRLPDIMTFEQRRRAIRTCAELKRINPFYSPDDVAVAEHFGNLPSDSPVIDQRTGYIKGTTANGEALRGERESASSFPRTAETPAVDTSDDADADGAGDTVFALEEVPVTVKVSAILDMLMGQAIDDGSPLAIEMFTAKVGRDEAPERLRTVFKMKGRKHEFEGDYAAFLKKMSRFTEFKSITG